MEFILRKVIWYMIYIYTHVAIYHNIHKLLSRTYIACMDVKVHTIVYLHLQWSFGVTCWEVFSAGKTPYPGLGAMTVVNMVGEGYRMEKPKNNSCTDEM